jgi:hypothetical protein
VAATPAQAQRPPRLLKPQWLRRHQDPQKRIKKERQPHQQGGLANSEAAKAPVVREVRKGAEASSWRKTR